MDWGLKTKPTVNPTTKKAIRIGLQMQHCFSFFKQKLGKILYTNQKKNAVAELNTEVHCS